MNQIMQFFEYKHLPERSHHRAVSEKFYVMAQVMDQEVPECEEKNVGLRKLLEAKDCMVRAALT